MSNSTAGRADPYWYEWTVGLVRVVEMMHPDSTTRAVSFQVEGIKGWDDVVVEEADDQKIFLQIKHSRVEGETFTFGDLVGRSKDDPSLLEELYGAWRKMGKPRDERARFVIFSNRAIGERGSRTDAGVQRPRLDHFIEWLRLTARRAVTMADFAPKAEWQDAWTEWLGQLAAGDDMERLAFLRALELETGQGDLAELEALVLENLGQMFQIPPARAVPLLQALDHALRGWTTGMERVTAEDAYTALALPPELSELALSPPPPAPFFQSREDAGKDLEEWLSAGSDQPPVLFLSAEPGEGKTSIVSRLTNRRVEAPLTNLIGLRYFCFEPITPESPLIAEDAGERVRADRLWLSLLAQLRDGLKGRLRELRVPVRNDLLFWTEARGHVLRVAAVLGREQGRSFIIAIDGIDHAARAMQSQGPQAQAFFSSLPGPDELAGTGVRLFIAGQPAEHYSGYPDWLREGHPGVKTASLPPLGMNDVLELYRASPTSLPMTEMADAVEVIMVAAKGNTLATVFAVAEAQTCTSVRELSERLEQRRLHDGVQRYYETIWNFALAESGPASKPVEPCVIGALTLAREGISSALLADVFHAWAYPHPFWRHLLVRLGPLLIEGTDGFRVRHNDVRVFLARRFFMVSAVDRRKIASDLADHYFSAQCNRLAAHSSLFSLLDQAGRTGERARVFTVDWVFEAGALAVGNEQLRQECTQALQAVSRLRDWTVMGELACAAQTLDRLLQSRRDTQTTAPKVVMAEMPFALPSEITVVPVRDWGMEHLQGLHKDARRLLDAGLTARTEALIHRWLGGMEVIRWAGAFHLLEEGEAEGTTRQFRSDSSQLLEAMGRLCRRVRVIFEPGEPEVDIDHLVLHSFEHGYILESCQEADAQDLKTLLGGWRVSYLDNLKEVTGRLATQGRWHLMGECLTVLKQERDRLDGSFRALAAYWSLRAGQGDPEWLSPLSQASYGLDGQGGEVPAYLAICRAHAWIDAAREPAMIAEEVYALCGQQGRSTGEAGSYRLIFRSAAWLGRLLAVQSRHDWTVAREVILPTQVQALMNALWNVNLLRDFHFPHHSEAMALAEELVEVCHHLGGAHQAAVLEVATRELADSPFDRRQQGLWKAMQLAGRFDVLGGLTRHWIGPEGTVWKQRADFPEDTVEEICELARSIGEEALAHAASERSRWSRIGYRSHEDDAFRPAAELYSRLGRLAPESWRGVGRLLWELSEKCEVLGGDNHWQYDIDADFSRAAFRTGPNDVWRQFCLWRDHQQGDDWNWRLRNRIVSGVTALLTEERGCRQEDKITLWCLAVGLCRWFEEGDVKSLWRLQSDLLDSAGAEDERAYLRDEIVRLTPGEARRVPPAEAEGPSSSAGEAAPADHDAAEECERRLAEGQLLAPRQVAAAIRRVLESEGAGDGFQKRVSGWMVAIGEKEDYAMGWRHHSREEREAIFEIARLVPDDTLWSLLEGMLSSLGRGEYWLTGVVDNLHILALARATARGPAELQQLLDTILTMHSRWLDGRDSEQEPHKSDEHEPSRTEAVDGWPEVTLRIFLHLLGARSCETISSTITGIHALVEHRPELATRAFALIDGDQWKTRWLLNCAEAWAAILPEALEPLRETLAAMTSAEKPLDSRLQAWIVLARLSDSTGRPRPLFPLIQAPEPASALVLLPKAIMQTEDTVHGSMRLSDLHGSIRSKLKRLEVCTGNPLGDVESRAAELLAATDLAPPNKRASMGRHGDFAAGLTHSEDILSRALAPVLNGKRWRQSAVPRLAQGFLDSEDPWVLRRSPLPSDCLDEWPDSDRLAGSYERRPPSANIEPLLFQLAASHLLPPGTQVLAARVQVFSWREDFTLWYWWSAVEARPEGIVDAPPLPICPSGRTFLSWLGDHYEPGFTSGLLPLAYFSMGTQRLPHSFPEAQLSRRLTKTMRWSAAIHDPTRWHRDGKQVARYENMHGPMRATPHGPHYRKPLLGRWLVSNEAFAEIQSRLDGLRPFWNFQRMDNDLER